MKRLIQFTLLLLSIILISGCSKNSVNLPSSKPIIDESLPIVDASSIRTIPDMGLIALEWKTFINPKVYGYHIYRSDILKNGEQLTRIATLKSKYTSHYLDTSLQPDKQYLYAIATMGKDNTESQPSKTITAATKQRFQSVSFITAISNLPRQIKLLWRPHTNPRVSHYRIERSNASTSKWKRIKTVKQRLQVEYIDTEIGDNVKYSYRIKAVTFDRIVSLPSQIVEATTKPLPEGIFTLKATYNIPSKIELSWQASNKNDLKYYNIYRANKSNGSYKFLAKQKLTNTSYEDVINENGAVKFYKITVVDEDGLESSKRVTPVMGKTLEVPRKPSITLAQIKDKEAIINWVAGDARTKSYNIYKTTIDGFFSRKTKVTKNITTTRYSDKDIKRGLSYKYSIEGVDKYGLVSKKTTQIPLSIPEIEEKEEDAAPVSN